MKPLLSLDTAYSRINNIAPIAKTETLPINAALAGRILAADAYAEHNVPPFKNSAVDGFALACTNGLAGMQFTVTQRLPAGQNAQPLNTNAAAQVFTGAMIPPNTHSIVMHEDTETTAQKVKLLKNAQAGAHIRYAGEDFVANTAILAKGTKLDSRHIAALAVAGVQKVTVAQSLRIGVFSAGNEVHDITTPLTQGKIHDSNRPALRALLQRNGLMATDLGIVPDHAESMSNFMQQHSAHYDILLGSAGMSMSDTDHTANTMARLGEVIFWQLAIKPARPIGLARIQYNQHLCYFLGLPGNPASCLLAAWLVGLPIITRLCGGLATLPKPQQVTCGFDLHKKPHRREFIRVQIDSNNTAHRVLPSGSATLSSLITANGILDIPEQQSRLAVGDSVLYYPFNHFSII